MVELKAVVSKFVVISSNLSVSLHRFDDRYLLALSDESEEINYQVFRVFACASSDTSLTVLYKLGYFDGYDELLHIAVEIVEMRQAFGHEEEDVKGHIVFMLSNYRNGNQLTASPPPPPPEISRKSLPFRVENVLQKKNKKKNRNVHEKCELRTMKIQREINCG
ncbi:uncharacterized protein LOC126850604 [Cataglyphis hispanica]|uniref:uncharacterized protein LOC126850604 n=1 Tax=Cataglyphis hispanica TaxID=1086592 RepID=UPI00217F6EFA|nr:uncharacterized protein LOC126850604 [Cataglyphis hispanica]